MFAWNFSVFLEWDLRGFFISWVCWVLCSVFSFSSLSCLVCLSRPCPLTSSFLSYFCLPVKSVLSLCLFAPCLCVSIWFLCSVSVLCSFARVLCLPCAVSVCFLFILIVFVSVPCVQLCFPCLIMSTLFQLCCLSSVLSLSCVFQSSACLSSLSCHHWSLLVCARTPC